MSNIRKSFSFREGVQVDNEVFVVRGPLVGIGTTIPTEKLDIANGTLRVAGLVTSGSLIVSGITTSSRIKVGNNVDIIGSTGVVTAVRYYGDGSTLSNLPTSQWIDVDVGLGFTSIYAQGTVGVATISPTKSLQIGGDPDFGRIGVGINSIGNIIASGVMTARSFYGSGVGLTALNASELYSGTISNDRLPTIENTKFPTNISVSGIITASTGFRGGSIVGTSITSTNITNSGIITSSGGFIGTLTGTATTATTLTGTPDIFVGVITGTSLKLSNSELTSSGIITANRLQVSSILASSNIQTAISTVTTTLHVGTAATGLFVSGGRVGIGTSVPNSDLTIRKRGLVSLDVISDDNQARIGIGQLLSSGSNNALIRYGGLIGGFEVINNGLGPINHTLHAGAPGVGTDNFNWIYGQGNEYLMTLTYDGKLGIGKQFPEYNLDVVGTSSITSDLSIGGNFYSEGEITFGSGITRTTLGSASQQSVLYNTNIYAPSGISTTYNLYVANKIGIGNSSPITDIDARNKTALFSAVSIGATDASSPYEFTVLGETVMTNTLGINTTTIKTSATYDAGILQIIDGKIKFYESGGIIFQGYGSIGFNTDSPITAFDMSKATDSNGVRSTLIPPILTSTERTTLDSNGIPEGSIIYNSTRQRLQYFNNNAWGTAGPVAWAYWNGTTLSASYNVSSVSVQTSTLRFNFAISLEDTNYSVVATPVSPTGSGNNRTSRVTTKNVAYVDTVTIDLSGNAFTNEGISIAVFR